MTNWLQETAQALIDNINSSGVSAKNNHNSHLLNVVGLIGFTTEDQSLITYAIDGYKKQIEQDLYPDGSSLDFEQRDALYYHVFTLEPLLSLARVAELNGIDLYSYQAPGGASLKKSVDWLLPYAQGQKTHAEWVHSTVSFDRQRAANGQTEFELGTLFRPIQAYPALELAAYFDSTLQPLALSISPTQAKRYPDFEAVYLDALR